MDCVIVTWLTSITHSHCFVHQQASSGCMTSSAVKGLGPYIRSHVL